MTEPAIVVPPPFGSSVKQDRLFREAINNSIRRVKTDLLDFMDLQRANGRISGLGIPDEFWELMRRRIHSSSSNAEAQILAAWVIMLNGGEIPAFGRPADQVKETQARKQEMGVTR